ncbi:glycine-rich cell wall structural protein 1 isoform X2 [Athalia rosae]|uniref:glycine-rich cell wall structural protein 1 isoform X2 n=1 Tax=Athalia rosae TaxID=37344 RepID=UPI0020335446|nr:glycine-rich cell wall structural protein 1 isoform X2 [Athalia rosae]
MTDEKIVSTAAPRKTKIFVGRLPENCRNEELRQLFQRFGEVTECDVMNRYGFVHMAREEDATTAIKTLHNSNFKGATINVEQSTGKSRGGGGGGGARRDGDRRGGPMRGGRGGRDGGRDGRPGPYNDRRGGRESGFGGNDRGGRGDFGRRGDFGGGRNGPGAGSGYNDYGNRGGGDYAGRGADFGGGYNDRGGYGQNNVSGLGGYATSSSGMGGAYGPATGSTGGYGPAVSADYGRGADFGRAADFGTRADFGGRASAGMGGDFNRGGPADYGRTENFGGARTAEYPPRNDYDRGVTGPMRNGGATTAYGGGFAESGGFPEGSGVVGHGGPGGPGGFNQGGQSQCNRTDGPPPNNMPPFNRPIGAVPNYSTGPGPQADMFSRRPGSAAPTGGYPPVGGGYTDGYDRADPYGPRSTGRSTKTICPPFIQNKESEKAEYPEVMDPIQNHPPAIASMEVRQPG